VNHTLSQSVTAPVLTTVQGAIRVFASELIDSACEVRKEWQAAAETLPTGEPLADDVPMEKRKLEMNRGPLTPDHLREALRRIKKGRDGALPGQLGLSLAGLEHTIPRNGGRRLFR
jgi:transcription initiation factor TFIID subunit 11